MADSIHMGTRTAIKSSVLTTTTSSVGGIGRLYIYPKRSTYVRTCLPCFQDLQSQATNPRIENGVKSPSSV